MSAANQEQLRAVNAGYFYDIDKHNIPHIYAKISDGTEIIISLVDGSLIETDRNLLPSKQKMALRVVNDNIQKFRELWNKYTPQRPVNIETGQIENDITKS